MRVAKPHRGHNTDSERVSSSTGDPAWVLEQGGEAVIVKNLNAVVTYWNPEAASLYGFSAEEAIGQPVRTLHAAKLSDADYDSLLERVRAGRPTSSTAERCKKSGEIVHVSMKTTPLLDEQGALIGEITIARDVTHPQAVDFSPGSVASNPMAPILIRWALNEAPLNEILVGLAILAVSGGMALFWPGTAIAAAVLIRLPRIRWISATVSIVAALWVVNLVAAHRSLPIAALLTGVNVAEITMMVAAFRAWRFEERLRAVFGRAFHLDRPAALLAIDLDRFKAVNDAAGHAAGDAVLCKVAETCRLAVRSTDVVGRLGGDEFAIILDNCNEGRAKQIGQQLSKPNDKAVAGC